MSEKDARLVSIANDIIRATADCGEDEAESSSSTNNVIELNEREQRAAEVPSGDILIIDAEIKLV